MPNVLDTLFLPYVKGAVRASEGPVAFINAQYHPVLDDIGKANLFLQQYFKPYAGRLQEQGFAVNSDFRDETGIYEAVFIALPKNMSEACYLTAQGLLMLRKGGALITAADNKAGGTRIKKMLQNFGLEDVAEESKNKARVCWARKHVANPKALETALHQGSVQDILSGEFKSLPGIFGWDKIDKGSEILLRHVPDEFDGNGADFGCGYGYLSAHILKHARHLNSFICIDADYRAVKICRDNIEKLKPAGTVVRYLWEDLTQSISISDDLDWIVMNPPFHEAKNNDPDIGIAFIKNAAKALRPGGMLWMVANASLPYEKSLGQYFSKFRKQFEGEGFKVYCAEK